MAKHYAEWAARWRVALGFALAALYLILAQPTAVLLAAGSCTALAGVLVRAWAAGYLEKNQSLASGGPYAYTRNPLYLGSFLLGLGFALAGASWIAGIAFGVYFVLIYGPVMLREEQHLREQFGEVYTRYAEGVSLFFPLRRGPAVPSQVFQWKRYRRNREYQAALGYGGGLIFLALKLWLR